MPRLVDKFQLVMTEEVVKSGDRLVKCCGQLNEMECGKKERERELWNYHELVVSLKMRWFGFHMSSWPLTLSGSLLVSLVRGRDPSGPGGGASEFPPPGGCQAMCSSLRLCRRRGAGERIDAAELPAAPWHRSREACRLGRDELMECAIVHTRGSLSDRSNGAETSKMTVIQKKRAVRNN